MRTVKNILLNCNSNFIPVSNIRKFNGGCHVTKFASFKYQNIRVLFEKDLNKSVWTRVKLFWNLWCNFLQLLIGHPATTRLPKKLSYIWSTIEITTIDKQLITNILVKLNIKFIHWFFLDVENSFVHGILTQSGLFEGTISTPTEEFHIEPVNRYFNRNITQEPTFHSIIYRLNDVTNPSKGLSCASQTLHQKKLLQEGGFGKSGRRRAKRWTFFPGKSFVLISRFRWLLQAESKLPYDDGMFFPNGTRRPFMSSFDINQQQIDEILEVDNRTHVDASALIFKNVFKRATIDPKKTTCMLYLQVRKPRKM